MKTFKPVKFKDEESREGFTVLSLGYYRVAQELKERSKTDVQDAPGHRYVFPAVIMYVSCMEAFFSEVLALELSLHPNHRKLIEVKAQLRPYDDFKVWVNEIFILFLGEGNGPDLGTSVFQNALALKELRNALIHYNPYMIDHMAWPQRLEQVLHQTKLELVKSGWVTNLSRPAVADWAHETVRNLIEEFSRRTGWESPFQAEYPFGWDSKRP